MQRYQTITEIKGNIMHATRIAVITAGFLTIIASHWAPAITTAQDRLSGSVRGAGWQQLFDGKTVDTDIWMMREPGAWVAENGTLISKGKGDLYSRKKYGNFFLQCEFKVAAGCNSGIYFRISDLEDRGNTSFEVQLIDMRARQKFDSHSVGSIYDRQGPNAKAWNPTGEWNHIMVLCLDNNVKVRLNDQLIIDANIDDWAVPHVNPDGTWNKFRYSWRAMARVGHIGFQSHGDDTEGKLWLRKIRIYELP